MHYVIMNLTSRSSVSFGVFKKKMETGDGVRAKSEKLSVLD